MNMHLKNIKYYQQFKLKGEKMGSSGGWSIPPSSRRNSTKCEDLSIEMYISSPQMNLIDELDLNELLYIKNTNNTLTVYTEENKCLGSLINAEVIDIMECIKKGFRFRAHILKIDGADILISVAPLKI